MRHMEKAKSDIRRIDDNIIELIGERLKRSKEIGMIKAERLEGVRDMEAEMAMVDRFRTMAEMVGLHPDAAEDICRIIIEQTTSVQASIPRRPADKKTIAIIGGEGKMGKMMRRLFERSEHDVISIDPVMKGGLRLENASAADVVIVSVPISSVSDTLRSLDRVCKEDALIFDISSLKSPFIDVLKEMGHRRKVCSAHPMFGPSVRSMHGRNLVICDCGSKAAVKEAADLMRDQGANMKTMDVDEHDRFMSYVLGLSHIVNIAFFTVLERSGISFRELCSVGSTTFDKMVDTNMSVALEDPYLYYEIQHLNTNRDRMLDELSGAIHDVAEAAVSRDAASFKELMIRGREYFEE